MDLAVPFKQQRRCNFPDFVSSDPQRSTILLRSGCMSQSNHQAQPERNGVVGLPLLPSTCQNEQTFDARTLLLHLGQVLPKGSDGAEQQFISIATNKVVKGRNRELLEARVKNGRILGLSHKVRKKEEGTGTPTA